jgi:hypothetical protein
MRRAVAAPALLALLLAACHPGGNAPAGREADHAHGGRTEAVRVNPIPYVEIPVTDMARAIAFYTAVFAVDLERRTVDGYNMALFPADDGPGAKAALAKGDVYRPSKEGAIVYFGVADIEATVARATAAGGRVLYPVKDIGEFGFVAEIEDSEGNRIALSQPRG